MTQNYVEARNWYNKAAAGGLAEAEYMVGEYHRTGIGGLKKDGAVALAWFLLASRKGHSGAAWHLARLAGIEPTTLGFGGQYSIH